MEMRVIVELLGEEKPDMQLHVTERNPSILMDMNERKYQVS